MEELERGPYFSELVAETLNSAPDLGRISANDAADNLFRDLLEGTIKHAAGNFFRRSEFYVRLFEEQEFDIDFCSKCTPKPSKILKFKLDTLRR